MFLHGLRQVAFTPHALHIPDNFLSVGVALVGWALMVAALAFALRQTRGQLGEKQIPLMGVLAAFIFAAQAINFPVAGGTSGHLLGGALAAILVGPWAAALVMTSVVIVQALVFQDGGLLALGFNVVNMGLLTAFTGHLVYTLLQRLFGEGRRSLLIAGAVGAWLSVLAGAAATAIELAASGIVPLALALPAMLGVHVLIGLGEALITVGALSFIYLTRRDVLRLGETAPAKASAHGVAAGLGVALLVAALSFATDPNPDGLERVALDLGFAQRGLAPLFQLFPDYMLPFINHPMLSGVLAVVVGTLLVFGLMWWIARRVGKPAS